MAEVIPNDGQKTFGSFIKAKRTEKNLSQKELAEILFVTEGAVMFFFTNYVMTALFGPSGNHYQVDFHNWEQCANGNIHLICLIVFLFISIVFLGIGIIRVRNIQKTDP